MSARYEVTTAQTLYLNYIVDAVSAREAQMIVEEHLRQAETNPVRFSFAGPEDCDLEVWDPLNADDEWVLQVEESDA